MCNKCDTLRRHITASRMLSTELTDPVSIAFNRADIKALEESLVRVIAKHHPTAK
jgi:hypothetical protein